MRRVHNSCLKSKQTCNSHGFLSLYMQTQRAVVVNSVSVFCNGFVPAFKLIGSIRFSAYSFRFIFLADTCVCETNDLFIRAFSLQSSRNSSPPPYLVLRRPVSLSLYPVFPSVSSCGGDAFLLGRARMPAACRSAAAAAGFGHYICLRPSGASDGSVYDVSRGSKDF